MLDERAEALLNELVCARKLPGRGYGTEAEVAAKHLRFAAAAAYEEAAKVVAAHNHEMRGLIIGKAIAKELAAFTDGDEHAPTIREGSAVERLVHEVCRLQKHIIAQTIRSLAASRRGVAGLDSVAGGARSGDRNEP